MSPFHVILNCFRACCLLVYLLFVYCFSINQTVGFLYELFCFSFPHVAIFESILVYFIDLLIIGNRWWSDVDNVHIIFVQYTVMARRKCEYPKWSIREGYFTEGAARTEITLV